MNATVDSWPDNDLNPVVESRLRVLLLAPGITRAGGGVPFVVKAHARALMARGDVEVRILALRDGAMTPDEMADWDGLDISAFPIVGSPRYGFSPGLLRAVMKAQCDVMHVHGIWQFQCLAALVKHSLSGTPYLISPHGMLEPWIRARSRALKAAVSKLYQDRFFRKAEACHVLTKIEADQVHDVAPSVRCAIISNSIEPATAGLAPPDWWSSDLNGRDIFLFLGRLHIKKGCVELCEAWERLNAADAKFSARSALIFCGPVDSIPNFENKVAALDARFGNVRYAGPQYGSAKSRSLEHADFLCLPSKSEGLPVTILEGWAAGIIPIMTRACNLDIGFERDAALETGVDEVAIFDALTQASGLSRKRRAQISAHARQLIVDEFSPSALAETLIAEYRRAVVKNNE